ncbi:uncharacterized protein LOC127788712 [Diospyros lotus]|uniref:uncharacterized protein LOC127788712 n=1 Tax=Diospyros lotus TaxID=55363 RepID=UPI00224EFDDE|nr:uncharacterized protein LOC127788712 [Diospyros lotus]
MVRELRCPLHATLPLAVTVANGSKMISKYRCRDFTWRMQGHEFTTELRILHLGGCHIVSGVDWMKTVSPLIFDFNTLEVAFEKEGKRLTLIGCLEEGECKVISSSNLKKLTEHGGAAIAQLHSLYAIVLAEEQGNTEGEAAVDHSWFNLDAVVTPPSEVPLKAVVLSIKGKGSLDFA